MPNVQWKGEPGHFIGASDCLFHLHTQVGRYRISTIGAYYPSSLRDNSGWEQSDVGLGRKYETYVFSDKSGWSEIDSLAANDGSTAEANHMELLDKYTAIAQTEEEDDL